jgi:hypothetical protein
LVRPSRFGINAGRTAAGTSWSAPCRKVEDLGYWTLVMPDHYELDGLEGQAKPVQRPHAPLLLGGAGRRMLEFAARNAEAVGIAPSLRARSLGRQPPAETVRATGLATNQVVLIETTLRSDGFRTVRAMKFDTAQVEIWQQR